MRQLKRRPLAAVIAIAIGVLLGCVNRRVVDKDLTIDDQSIAAQLAASRAPVGPQIVTDLGTLSTADTVAVPAAPTLKPAIQPAANPPTANRELTGKLTANAPTTRFNPERANPGIGGVRLLNDKARQFATFSELLLDQSEKAAQQLAPTTLEQHRVPDDLDTVVLTAVLDQNGRLKEIVVEQHSGDLTVDHLFIDACKKGIWSRNPPVGAIGNDGMYRLRVEGKVYSTGFDRYGQYSYDTEMGLAIQ